MSINSVRAGPAMGKKLMRNSVSQVFALAAASLKTTAGCVCMCALKLALDCERMCVFMLLKVRAGAPPRLHLLSQVQKAVPDHFKAC